MAGREARGCRRAERSKQGHLRDKKRVAGVGSGQCPEPGDRLRIGRVVLGVAMHVFEPVDFRVGNRHEFDESVAGRMGDPRLLSKLVPAPEICLDGPRRSGQDLAQANPRDEIKDACDADEAHPVPGATPGTRRGRGIPFSL